MDGFYLSGEELFSFGSQLFVVNLTLRTHTVHYSIDQIK